MYAFEGQILILHYSYFYKEVTGKHKIERERWGGLESGQQKVVTLEQR